MDINKVIEDLNDIGKTDAGQLLLFITGSEAYNLFGYCNQIVNLLNKVIEHPYEKDSMNALTNAITKEYAIYYKIVLEPDICTDNYYMVYPSEVNTRASINKFIHTYQYRENAPVWVKQTIDKLSKLVRAVERYLIDLVLDASDQ